MTGTDVTPPDSEPRNISEPPIAPAQPSSAPKQRNSPILPILGGGIAALFGFALALIVPSGWPIGGASSEITDLQAAHQAQAERIAELEVQLAKPVEMPDLANQIEALRTDIGAAQTTIDTQAQALTALAERITAVENQPLADGSPSPAALTALRADLTSLRTLVETQQGQGGTASADLVALLEQSKSELAAATEKAAQLQAEFAQTASQATGRAAMLQISAAMEIGGPFDGALDDLASVGFTVPDSLRAHSAGVPSLADLQAGFGDPAREALSAALKAGVGDDAMSRVSAFLRNQVGARSLTAREGTDPDAVLSRAEAALAQGDLAVVLSEIDSLPDAGKVPLEPWVALVKSRIAAMTEVADLAASLGK